MIEINWPVFIGFGLLALVGIAVMFWPQIKKLVTSPGTAEVLDSSGFEDGAMKLIEAYNDLLKKHNALVAEHKRVCDGVQKLTEAAE